MGKRPAPLFPPKKILRRPRARGKTPHVSYHEPSGKRRSEAQDTSSHRSGRRLQTQTNNNLETKPQTRELLRTGGTRSPRAPAGLGEAGRLLGADPQKVEQNYQLPQQLHSWAGTRKPRQKDRGACLPTTLIAVTPGGRACEHPLTRAQGTPPSRAPSGESSWAWRGKERRTRAPTSCSGRSGRGERSKSSCVRPRKQVTE